MAHALLTRVLDPAVHLLSEASKKLVRVISLLTETGTLVGGSGRRWLPHSREGWAASVRARLQGRKPPSGSS